MQEKQGSDRNDDIEHYKKHKRGGFCWWSAVHFCDDGVGRLRKKVGEISKRKTEGGVVVSMVMSA